MTTRLSLAGAIAIGAVGVELADELLYKRLPFDAGGRVVLLQTQDTAARRALRIQPTEALRSLRCHLRPFIDPKCELRPLSNRRWPSFQGELELGLGRALHIREERLSTLHDAYRLLYVSDVHLRRGRSDVLSGQVLDSVTRSNPDVVLLGGDLVDHRCELIKLSELVRKIQDVAQVLAIGGNHDHRIGINRVRAAVLHGGGQWIDDNSARLTHRGRLIVISGHRAGVPVDGHVRVLCAHNPRIWKTARHAGYDLVLAGHLHGCQLVAYEYRGRLFPCAFFYPYCFLNDRCGSTRLVVSRGVSDLVPIRWKCPREVVLCHV
jgi:predicted MPP superfamily phosphohydrolase